MGDRILACSMFVVGLLYLWMTFELPEGRSAADGAPGPSAFPTVLGVGLLGGAIWTGLGTLRRSRAAAANDVTVNRRSHWKHVLVAPGVAAASLVYLVVLNQAGFLVSSVPFLFLLLTLFDRRGWLLNAGVAVGFSGALFAVFRLLLNVPLPAGPFL